MPVTFGPANNSLVVAPHELATQHPPARGVGPPPLMGILRAMLARPHLVGPAPPTVGAAADVGHHVRPAALGDLRELFLVGHDAPNICRAARRRAYWNSKCEGDNYNIDRPPGHYKGDLCGGLSLRARTPRRQRPGPPAERGYAAIHAPLLSRW
jgi:hypothetical protein